MAQRVRIRCINKTNRTSAHERIHNIGWVNADSTRWKLTETKAIQDIQNGTYAFYVEQPAGHHVGVIVATRLGVQYLKTVADGEQPDNLLSLPECP
jgi:hypothetical protein